MYPAKADKSWAMGKGEIYPLPHPHKKRPLIQLAGAFFNFHESGITCDFGI
jgi:hypothetical protein